MKKSLNYLPILLVLTFFSLLSFCRKEISGGITVNNLTCELATNPVGISVKAPKLGWRISSKSHHFIQEAYQVIVASTKEKLNKNEGDVWNSGKTASTKSQHITYQGKSLRPAQKYYWKVKVWGDNEGSEWSIFSVWQMAPDLTKNQPEWIGAITRADSHLPKGRKFHVPTFKKAKRDSIIAAADPLATRSIMLRKEFQASKKIKSATLYISGLGHYKCYLNGNSIGESQFAPLWSDYDKTVYYNTYDVSKELNAGKNTIGVLLGNGMYNTLGKRYAKFYVCFGPPTLWTLLRVTYEDGTEKTLTSDDSWKYAESPITFNTIFGGEDYDATLEQPGWKKSGFNAAEWKPVVVQNPPKGKLRPQTAPPIKIEKQYDVQQVVKQDSSGYVLDMGQNLSGFPSIKVKGKKGQTVRIWIAEKLKDDRTITQGGSGKPYHYDYTLKGNGIETWQPSFSYYGFQYVQLEGANYKTEQNDTLPTVLEVKSNFAYNSAGEAGSFECSNEIFNNAHQLINNSIKSNFQSVFTDCPHREKLGWLEETHLNGPGLFYNYNLQTFIPKVMQDIADAQRENGLIPNIAPEYIVFGGDFTDSPEWGIAGVMLPWMYYNYYGDESLLEKYYPVMKRYVDYLSSTAENHIVSQGLGDWYDYGDHAAGYSQNSPIPLSATSHYYYAAKLVAKAAKLLKKTEDAQKYSALTHTVQKAFNQRFFHQDSKAYGTGSQFSNAVPLFMDIVMPENREAVMKNLLADIKKHGYRLTTGDVGNRYLYQTLARNGENEVMYKMQNHYDTPGYGFQIKFGLTTLTEQWDPRNGNSLNHFMMGQIEEWFYRSLAGIVPDEENPGFKHFFLQPKIVGDMTYTKATYNSIYGKIHSEWKKEDDKIEFKFTIPGNTSATLLLPVKDDAEITINGEKLEDSKVAEVKANSRSFELGSGTYQITAE